MSDILVVGGQITRNFNIYEFAHKRKEIYFDEQFFMFVQCLQEFRDWYNRPMNITSGYRPAKYNKSIGGSPNSSHLVSLAVDFSLPMNEFKNYSDSRKLEFLQNVLQKWSAICSEINQAYQVNWYDTYLHLGFSLNDEISFIDKRKVK